MRATVLIYYSTGTVSVISTCAVAILSGLCYATSKSSPSDSPALELTVVGLHVMSCIELVILALLLRKTVKSGLTDWTGLKTWMCCCIGVFLFTNTAAAAAAMGWRDPQAMLGRSQAMVISQCVIWAVSVFHQGLFCGFLLVAVTKRGHCRGGQYSLRQDMDDRKCSSAKGRGRPMLPSLHYNRQLQSAPTSPRTMSEGLSPVQSFAANIGTQGLNRYSGRTLFPLDSRRSSFDLYSRESSSMRMKLHVRQTSHDTCSTISENNTRRWQKSYSGVKSLDSVVLQPSSPGPSTPTVPSLTTSEAKPVLAKQKTLHENHIHPLFRTGSASPPPTPAPGTMVTASPAAGHTISPKMLNRMRSPPLVQASGERIKSTSTGRGASFSFTDALHESASPGENWPLPIGGIGSQGVSWREKDYGLNESPHEG